VTIPRFSLSHDTLRPADNAKYLKPLINGTDHRAECTIRRIARMVTSTPPTVDHDSLGMNKSSGFCQYARASGVDQLLCSDCARFLRRLETQRG
jgi:hypothetical protein